MKSELIIDKKDYLAFFYYQYYNSKILWIRLMRYIGGPIIILLGIFFLSRDEKFGIAYGGFCIGYGIYYIIKPLLFVLIKKYKTQRITVEDTQLYLILESVEGKSEVDLNKLKTFKTKRFFVLQLENNQSIFLPKHKMSAELKNALDEKIKNIA